MVIKNVWRDLNNKIDQIATTTIHEMTAMHQFSVDEILFFCCENITDTI